MATLTSYISKKYHLPSVHQRAKKVLTSLTFFVSSLCAY